MLSRVVGPIVLLWAAAAPAAVAEYPYPAYDCDLEYDNWETLWNPGWKAWCCLNRNKGCEATVTSTTFTTTDTSTTATATTSTQTTSTETSSTQTSSTSSLTSLTRTQTSTTVSTTTQISVTETTTTTMSPEVACKQTCNQGGSEATCQDRINWVSKHDTVNEANACEAAAVLVIADCSEECGRCTAAAAQCGQQLYVKRYDEEAQKQAKILLLESHDSRFALVASFALFAGASSLLVMGVRSFRGRRTASIYQDVLLEEA